MGKRTWVRTMGAVVALATAGTVAFAVPATAGGQPTTVVKTVMTADAAGPSKVCDRLKKVAQKREAVVARLQAGADTRGSAAWLNAKAEAATAAGDTALAKLYTDKANLRSQLIDPLQGVNADLQAIIAIKCG